jgi:ABC-type lipoprotein release transport system permease subunit
MADAGEMQRWAPGQVQSVRLAVQDLYAAPQVSKDIAAGWAMPTRLTTGPTPRAACSAR